MRLKDRGKFPPGGFRWYTPQTNFSITPWVSFDAAVRQILDHRRANPHQCNVNNWSLDPAVIADELDAFNVQVCQSMNWNDWITDGGPDTNPKLQTRQSLLPQSLAHAAEGIKTIAEWEISGGNLVDRERANQRAKICSACPQNRMGTLADFFTETAARIIQKQLESKNDQKLVTDVDPLLGLCNACGCVTSLKVWAPLHIIRSKMKPQTAAALDAGCWIRNEGN